MDVTAVSVENLVSNYNAAVEAHRLAEGAGTMSEIAALFTGR